VRHNRYRDPASAAEGSPPPSCTKPPHRPEVLVTRRATAPSGEERDVRTAEPCVDRSRSFPRRCDPPNALAATSGRRMRLRQLKSLGGFPLLRTPADGSWGHAGVEGGRRTFARRSRECLRPTVRSYRLYARTTPDATQQSALRLDLAVHRTDVARLTVQKGVVGALDTSSSED
jgi:hypothetical protein